MAVNLSEPPEGHGSATGQGETCGPQAVLFTRRLLWIITGRRCTQMTTTALPAAQDDALQGAVCELITGAKGRSSDEATLV